MVVVQGVNRHPQLIFAIWPLSGVDPTLPLDSKLAIYCFCPLILDSTILILSSKETSVYND